MEGWTALETKWWFCSHAAQGWLSLRWSAQTCLYGCPWCPCMHTTAPVNISEKQSQKVLNPKIWDLWSRRCPDEAWAASDCWDSTLQISTIIKMLASLNHHCVALCHVFLTFFFPPPFLLLLLISLQRICNRGRSSNPCQDGNIQKRIQDLNAASWSLSLRSLIGSLARLCTWPNMTGARLENELIRWDANEREESGELGSAHWPANHPVVGLCLILFYGSVTQRDD